MMTGRALKGQSSVEQRHRQPGLGLGLLRVEASILCAVGGLSDVPEMRGTGQGEWRLALGNKVEANTNREHMEVAAIFRARRHGTGQFDVAMDFAARETLGGEARVHAVFDKQRMVKEVYRSRFCVSGSHVSYSAVKFARV